MREVSKNLSDFTSFFVKKPDTVRAAKIMKTSDPDAVILDLPFIDDSPSAFNLRDICVW